jgi:hypothetical protein
MLSTAIFRSPGWRSRLAPAVLCLATATVLATAPTALAAQDRSALLDAATRAAPSATQAPVDSTSGVASDAQRAMGGALAGVVSQTRTAVRDATSAEPVRTAVESLREPIAAAVAPVRDAAPALDPVRRATGAASPRSTTDGRSGGGANGLASDGAVGPGAYRQTMLAPRLVGASAPRSLLDAFASVSPAVLPVRGDTSSTTAGSGEGTSGDPLFGMGGTDGGIAGPVGIALLLLAALIGLLSLAPRLRSRMLHMSPAFERPAALLRSPERPG